MKKFCLQLLCIFFILSGASSAFAVQITFNSVSGTGTYSGSLSLLTDGIFPPEGGQWQTNTVWWTGYTPVFTFDIGSIYNLDDIILSVDNNDNYLVEYSTNNSSWSNLFTISRFYGEINGGMDTMSTSPGPEYISNIDFSSVQARYLRINAFAGGDSLNSIGEFQAFGNLPNGNNGNNHATPEPTTMFLFGSGIIGLAGFRRRFKKL